MRITFTLAATFALALPTLVAGDFNGDGFEDLAVGVVGEATGGVIGAGAVQVFPGSAAGPSGADSIVLDATSFGLVNETSQFFGSSIAWGDFDGDGFDDLAIGARGTPVAGRYGAGRVYVAPGGASGFDFTKAKWFDQNTKGVKDKVEPETPTSSDSFEHFGWAVAAGDFDGNGFDDLAVGVPGEDIGAIESAGAVNVLFSQPGVGVTTAGDLILDQDQPGTPETAEESDAFGFVLSI